MMRDTKNTRRGVASRGGAFRAGAVALALSGAVIIAILAAPATSYGQCASIRCTVQAFLPTCAALPAEGLPGDEYLTVAVDCSCCTAMGTQSTCIPDEKIMPMIALFSGTSKVGGTFKPAGKKCRLIPAYMLDRTLDGGTYTVKVTNAEGMPSTMVKVQDSGGGCAVARGGRSMRAGLGLGALLFGLGTGGLALVRARSRRRSS